jgi:hypothetical protein
LVVVRDNFGLNQYISEFAHLAFKVRLQDECEQFSVRASLQFSHELLKHCLQVGLAFLEVY